MVPGDGRLGDGKLGGECAGVVAAVGPGVDDLREGDPVVAVAGGSFASRVTVPAVRAARIPDGLTFEQAAAIPVPGFTAWHALPALRSEERRVGKEWDSTCGSRWSRHH